MRLVFMGTPRFAAEALSKLLDTGHDIAAVYSQPPRAAGRGQAVRPSAVHELALERGLDIRTPVSLKSAAEHVAFEGLKADAGIVAAYGLLLPRTILEAPAHGCFNIHASLLPRWRGAAPIQRAIMAGDPYTGVSIMKMDEGLDTGPVCRVQRLVIAPEMTAGALHDELARIGAELIVETLAQFPPQCVPQPNEGVTYARKIDKAEAKIDFNQGADMVRNHIHGLSPFPGAWFSADGARVKVLACATAVSGGPPGTLLDDTLTIACKSGAVRLLTVQREGKAPMDAQSFLRGFQLKSGMVL